MRPYDIWRKIYETLLFWEVIKGDIIQSIHAVHLYFFCPARAARHACGSVPSADIQIVEKREAPLLGSKVTESEDLALWYEENDISF